MKPVNLAARLKVQIDASIEMILDFRDRLRRLRGRLIGGGLRIFGVFGVDLRALSKYCFVRPVQNELFTAFASSVQADNAVRVHLCNNNSETHSNRSP